MNGAHATATPAERFRIVCLAEDFPAVPRFDEVALVGVPDGADRRT